MKTSLLRKEVVVKRLNEHRLKRWWVAERVGVHRSTLRRWLSGQIGRVKNTNVDRLAEVLELSTTRLAILED